MKNIYVKDSIRCEFCGSDFPIKRYTFVDATGKKRLRRFIAEGNMYNFECPFCQNFNRYTYPFTYADYNRGIEIVQGSTIGLLSDYDSNCGIHCGIRTIGAERPCDLMTKITLLEEGLDLKIGTLYEMIETQKFEEERINNNLPCEIVYGVLTYDRDEVVHKICYISGLTGDVRYKIIPFDKSFYDELEKKYGKDIKRTNGYLFNRDAAARFFMMKSYSEKFSDGSIENFIDKDKEFCIVSLKDRDIIAFTSDKDTGKICHGDKVCVKDEEGKLKRGLVLNAYLTCSYHCPLTPENHLKISKKIKGSDDIFAQRAISRY